MSAHADNSNNRMRFPELLQRWIAEGLSRETKLVDEWTAAGHRPDATGGFRVFLFGHKSDLVFFKYAAGAPLDEVREVMRSAATTKWELVEAREQARRSGLETVDPALYGGDFPGEFSATNSLDGLTATLFARLSGDRNLAACIARTIWDANDALYLGLRREKYVLVTMAEHFLAYSYRDLFLRDEKASAEHARRVRTTEEQLLAERRLIEAVLARNGPKFLDELTTYLTRHAHVHLNHRREDWEYLLAIRALGFSLEALERNLFELPDLPANSPYFPLELLQAALADGRVGPQ